LHGGKRSLGTTGVPGVGVGAWNGEADSRDPRGCFEGLYIVKSDASLGFPKNLERSSTRMDGIEGMNGGLVSLRSKLPPEFLSKERNPKEFAGADVCLASFTTRVLLFRGMVRLSPMFEVSLAIARRKHFL
jgi:hypothetical protein